VQSIIDQVTKSTRDRSEMLARAVNGGGAAGGSGGGNPLGLGSGGSNFGLGNKRNDLTIHQEQYRHNTGWVAASIKPIASRIARQPMRLAKVKAAPPQKAGGPHGTKDVKVTSAGEVRAKPWEKGTAAKTAAELWFRQVMPGVYKTVAQNAELVDAHPILDAIENPNPIMVRWSLMFVTVASLLLTGKAYWWIKAREEENENPEGQPAAPRIEIWPLPTHWVKAVHTETRLNDHWEVTPDGALEPTPVPAEQIVYFYFPDPSAILGSQSPLQNQARAVVSDEAIAEAQRRGFANGVFPGVAVVIGRQPDVNGAPGERPFLNRDQRAQILTAFKQAYRGVYNHDEPIILDKLIEDVKRITNTNREMDFRDSGEYTERKITLGFGTSTAIMGDVETPNKASSAAADAHFCDSTVNPIIEMLSQTLTAWFNPLMAGPNERYYLFIEEAKASDPDAARQDWTALYGAGGCSIDELRAGILNLPPMVDGNTAVVDGNKVRVDARLMSEMKPGEEPKPPHPLGGTARPGAGAFTQTPPEPDNTPDPDKPPVAVVPARAATQNSEPEAISGVVVADFVDTIYRLCKRKCTVETAQAVMWSIFFGIPGMKVKRAIAVVAVGSNLVREPSGAQIAEIGRILKVADEPGDNELPDKAEVEIPLEDFRGTKPYDCGSACAYPVAKAMGCEPGSYADFMVALDTEDEIGTTAEDIFAYFAAKGCNPVKKPNRTIEYLRSELRKGRLCICPVQYFGDGDASGGEGGAGYESGHWIAVNGYTRDGIRYHCSIDGPGEISNAEFLGNWYDRGTDGRPFTRFVISVGHCPEPITDPMTARGIKGKPQKTGSKTTDRNGMAHDNNGRFGSNGGGHAPTAETGKPEAHKPISPGGHDTGSIGHAPDALAKIAQGHIDAIKAHGAKAVAVAKSLGEKVKQLAVKASYHAMTSNLADDICDTSHDYSKIINAKGTHDWLSEHLGVSGNFAAKVASIALSHGYTKLKEWVKRRHQASLMLPTRAEGEEADNRLDAITIEQAAQHITDINRVMWAELGCPEAELPKLEDVRAWLIKRHDEHFAGDAGQGKDNANGNQN
jgi:phage portal protein BeeE